MRPMQGSRFVFGPFVLDPGAGTLVRNDEPVAVGYRGLKLLEALVGRPGEILGKAELMDAAWSGRAVEEGNLTVQIAQLRKMLGAPPDGGDGSPRFGGSATASRGLSKRPVARSEIHCRCRTNRP